MNPKYLSVTTLALLVILVAFPLVFILLQAVFPQFSAGVFSGAFSGVATLLAEPQLPPCWAVRCRWPSAWRWSAR